MKWYYAEGGATAGPLDPAGMAALIAAGRINRDTLVWIASMAGWEAAGGRAEFADMFAALPPPLPRSAPEPPPLPPPLSRRDTTAAPPLLTAEPMVSPIRLTPGDSRPATAAAEERLAGPWSRAFARLVDNWLLLELWGNGASYLLFHTSPVIAFVRTPLFALAFLLLALPAVNLTCAILTMLFGNTPGKALFGIRAKPANGEDYFTWPKVLARELRVWFFGEAAGMFLIAIFTQWVPFWKVLHGRPTGYDAGGAKVVLTSTSRARRPLAFTVVVLFMIGLYAFETLHTYELWFNPATGKPASLPLGWHHIETRDGIPSFYNGLTDHRAGLGSEPVGGDMDDFLSRLAAHYSKDTATSWTKLGGAPTVWTLRGHTADGTTEEFYATQIDQTFWYLVIQAGNNPPIHNSNDRELAKAMFWTLGVWARP